MRFGVCGDMSVAAAASKASYDYAEWSVPELLKPLEPEDAFLASLEAIRAAELPYEVSNGFIPAKLKITGHEVDTSALQTYVATAMERAERAGIEIIVFGSGGARQIPDGFDCDKAHDQLVGFCKSVAPVAHDHGVTVVVEPLNLAECNVLTSVDECAQLVNEVDLPGLRLLVDGYHMMRDGDPFDDIVKHGALLEHVHIATKENRLAPGAEDCDMSPFFRALRDADYTGRVSIEGNIKPPESTLPEALKIMRNLTDDV